MSIVQEQHESECAVFYMVNWTAYIKLHKLEHERCLKAYELSTPEDHTSEIRRRLKNSLRLYMQKRQLVVNHCNPGCSSVPKWYVISSLLLSSNYVPNIQIHLITMLTQIEYELMLLDISWLSLTRILQAGLMCQQNVVNI